jgi:hypothetical protein
MSIAALPPLRQISRLTVRLGLRAWLVAAVAHLVLFRAHRRVVAIGLGCPNLSPCFLRSRQKFDSWLRATDWISEGGWVGARGGGSTSWTVGTAGPASTRRRCVVRSMWVGMRNVLVHHPDATRSRASEASAGPVGVSFSVAATVTGSGSGLGRGIRQRSVVEADRLHPNRGVAGEGDLSRWQASGFGDVPCAGFVDRHLAAAAGF